MKTNFTMYIGLERTKSGGVIPPMLQRSAVECVQQIAAREFGGCSIGIVAGSYVNAEGQLTNERACRLDISAEEEDTPRLEQCARMFKDLFQQDSVMLMQTPVQTKFI